VSYNFVNLKEGATDEKLKEMTAERPLPLVVTAEKTPPLVIDDVVEAALNYGVN
jgi:hypothetical protein